MASTTDSYTTRFLGDDTSLRAATNRSKAGFDSLLKAGKAVGVGLVGVGVAGVAAAGGLAALFVRTNAQLEAFQKQRDRLDASTEALQAWAHAAELGGTSAEVAEKGALRLSRSIGDAGRGLKAAIDGFDDLGISFGELSQLEPLDALERFLQLLSQIDDRGRALSIGEALGGKAVRELLPLFERNRNVISEMREELRRTGRALSEEAPDAAGDLDDAVTELSQRWRDFTRQLSSQFAPIATAVLQGVAKDVDELAMSFGGYDQLANAAIGKTVQLVEDAIRAVRELADQFDRINDRLDQWSGNINTAATVADLAGSAVPGPPSVTQALDLAEQVRTIVDQVVARFGGGEAVEELRELNGQFRSAQVVKLELR